jgi:hypothetical protein
MAFVVEQDTAPNPSDIGEKLIFPLCNGTKFVGIVMGVLHKFPDSQMYEFASIEDEIETIYIGIWRADSHEFKDILCDEIAQYVD